MSSANFCSRELKFIEASASGFRRTNGLDPVVYEHLRVHLLFKVSERPILVIRPGKPLGTEITVRLHGQEADRRACVGEYSDDCKTCLETAGPLQNFLKRLQPKEKRLGSDSISGGPPVLRQKPRACNVTCQHQATSAHRSAASIANPKFYEATLHPPPPPRRPLKPNDSLNP